MTEPVLKLVTKRACPFAERVRIVLAFGRIAHEVETIDLRDPPDWFGSISPLRKVPVLLPGKAPIFESTAIMEYLVDLGGTASGLRPEDPVWRALMRGWMQFDETAMVPAFYRLLAATGTLRQEAAVKRYEELLLRLEHGPLASGEPWLLGADLTLADITIATHVLRLDAARTGHGVRVPALPARVAQWIERLADLPALRAAIASSDEMIADLDPYIGASARQAAA